MPSGEWGRANKEHVAEYNRQYSIKNRARKSRIQKEYTERHPDRVKGAVIKRRLQKYGLDHEEYQALLNEQSGVCKICHKADPKKDLAIDHDHETGAVRGLLCSKCNLRLEWYELYGPEIARYFDA